ncbi:MAG: DUF2550 family protein, partial [Acidimicrobiia bacterium]
IVVLVVTAAGAAIAMGGRHLYFRLSRPHGFECSLRTVRGEMPGLTNRFRAGHAGPEMRLLRWRRIAWPGPDVVFAATAVRVDRGRRPHAGERLAIPATFTVVPIELDSDTLLELALPTRRVPRLVALLSP